MKNIITGLLVGVTLLCPGKTQAQDNSTFYKMANRMSAGVSMGIEYASIDVATCLSKHLELRLAYSTAIGSESSMEIDVVGTDGTPGIMSDKASAKDTYKGASADLILSYYPLPDKFPFFVSGGLAFGHTEEKEIDVYHPEAAAQVAQGVALGIQVDRCFVPFDASGHAIARQRAHKLCPYIGFGVGRLIPKRRIAVRGEVGWYLHGKPKLYDGDGHRLHDVFTEADNNYLAGNPLDESSRFAMMCTVSVRLF